MTAKVSYLALRKDCPNANPAPRAAAGVLHVSGGVLTKHISIRQCKQSLCGKDPMGHKRAGTAARRASTEVRTNHVIGTKERRHCGRTERHYMESIV